MRNFSHNNTNPWYELKATTNMNSTHDHNKEISPTEPNGAGNLEGESFDGSNKGARDAQIESMDGRPQRRRGCLGFLRRWWWLILIILVIVILAVILPV